jgi:hypothetical protein
MRIGGLLNFLIKTSYSSKFTYIHTHTLEEEEEEEECAIKMDAETVDDVRDRLISRVLEALALG